MAETLARALATPEARLKEIGHNARAKVARDLNPPKIAQERMAAYRAAVQGQMTQTHAIPDWAKQLAMPREIGSGGLPFLEQLPLKKLSQHVGSRMMRKLGIGT